MTLIDKVKKNRLRQAEYMDEPIQVRVYSGPELKSMVEKIKGGVDTEIAEILAAQFLDSDGKPVFTPEFLLSDECPNVVFTEISMLFMAVNSGTHKKK
jgi:hypothetical protein